MDEHVDAWFAREILAHEEALVRYLQRCWPHADDIHDLRQVGRDIRILARCISA